MSIIIREDLVGVVVARDAVGHLVTLAAGDEVPDGVEVGDHLTETPKTARKTTK